MFIYYPGRKVKIYCPLLGYLHQKVFRYFNARHLGIFLTLNRNCLPYLSFGSIVFKLHRLAGGEVSFFTWFSFHISTERKYYLYSPGGSVLFLWQNGSLLREEKNLEIAVATVSDLNLCFPGPMLV